MSKELCGIIGIIIMLVYLTIRMCNHFQELLSAVESKTAVIATDYVFTNCIAYDNHKDKYCKCGYRRIQVGKHIFENSTIIKHDGISCAKCGLVVEELIKKK